MSSTGKVNMIYGLLFLQIPHEFGKEVPQPKSDTYIDRWDQDHVRMPCSPENMYPVETVKILYTISNRLEFLAYGEMVSDMS